MIISELLFELETENEDIKYFNFSSGVIFHSLFLDIVKSINEDHLTVLHSTDNAQRAYRIKIPKFENKIIKWPVYGLSKNIFEIFQNIQLNSPNQNIHVNHYNTFFNIKSISVNKICTYNDLVKENYLSLETVKQISLLVNTPVCFKDNQTSFFNPTPDPKLFIQSALKKWNSFSESSLNLEHENLFFDLSKSIFIKQYDLKTKTFQLNEITIPGFIGNITFGLKGTSQTKNLISMLFQYLTYSGVGIKTAMGMGDVEVVKKVDYKRQPESMDIKQPVTI